MYAYEITAITGILLNGIIFCSAGPCGEDADDAERGFTCKLHIGHYKRRYQPLYNKITVSNTFIGTVVLIENGQTNDDVDTHAFALTAAHNVEHETWEARIDSDIDEPMPKNVRFAQHHLHHNEFLKTINRNKFYSELNVWCFTKGNQTREAEPTQNRYRGKVAGPFEAFPISADNIFPSTVHAYGRLEGLDIAVIAIRKNKEFRDFTEVGLLKPIKLIPPSAMKQWSREMDHIWLDGREHIKVRFCGYGNIDREMKITPDTPQCHWLGVLSMDPYYKIDAGFFGFSEWPPINKSQPVPGHLSPAFEKASFRPEICWNVNWFRRKIMKTPIIKHVLLRRRMAFSGLSYGDSGGPYFIQRNNEFYLVAVFYDNYHTQLLKPDPNRIYSLGVLVGSTLVQEWIEKSIRQFQIISGMIP